MIKEEDIEKVIHEFFKEKVNYICGERKEVPFDEIDHILECNKELCSAIKEIPTAFNVEAVVEELEELNQLERNDECPMECICGNCEWSKYKCKGCYTGRAIEIVRKGGVKND